MALTLTSPVQVSFTKVQVRRLEVDDSAVLVLTLDVSDSAGNVEQFGLRHDAVSRQGLKVLASGRLGVYTETASGYAAALFTTFAGATGGVAGKFRAVETKLTTDGLLPGGAVS